MAQLLFYRYIIFAVLLIVFLAAFAFILYSKMRNKKDKIIVLLVLYVFMLVVAAMATAEYCC